MMRPSENPTKLSQLIGRENLKEALRWMLLIRNFEIRGEAAYQEGKVGGFYHSYMGQEAIQVACLTAAGPHHWYTTTYRCHALALLLGVEPKAAMAELYGKATGLAQGRGGSMHMYADRLLGGLAIVGGHVPIATGAGFTIRYLKQKGVASFCFLGDGAVVQGPVHESLNLATLWQLPCLYVIENNQWGMGTSVERAVCMKPIAEQMAKSYGISSYTFNGMNFFDCYAAFRDALQEVLSTSRPVLMEAVTERFRGHSISDPALYRTKETLQQCLQKDPIGQFKSDLIQQHVLTEAEFETMEEDARQIIRDALRYAEESPWPDPMRLEEGVFPDD